MTLLVYGYGNPGRRDDGLGVRFAELIEALDLPGVTVDSDYQLVVEDAVEVARHDVVLFADADAAGPGPFFVESIGPAAPGIGFSSHSVRPEAVLTMARDHFHAEPEAWLLGIRGFEFNEFGEGLSDAAQANLDAAVAALADRIRDRTLAPMGSCRAGAPAPACD